MRPAAELIQGAVDAPNPDPELDVWPRRGEVQVVVLADRGLAGSASAVLLGSASGTDFEFG